MPDKHFVLFYDTAPDYLERRPAHRAEHLALARAAWERGELVIAGALADPPDAALLVFKGHTDAAARSFAAADPYVHHGLVSAWRVREWITVVGDGALATPACPESPPHPTPPAPPRPTSPA